MSKSPKNPSVEKIIENLRNSLPAAFSRAVLPDLLPGFFSRQTLANLSNKGIGPPCFRNGKRRICYERDSFLSWLRVRIEEGEIKDNDNNEENS